LHKTITSIFVCSFLCAPLLMTAACKDDATSQAREQETVPASRPSAQPPQKRQDLPSQDEARALIESSDRIAQGRSVSYDISFDQVQCLAEQGIFARMGATLQGGSIDLTPEGRRYFSSDGPIRPGPYDPAPRATLHLAPAIQANPRFTNLTIDKIAPPRSVMETVTVSFSVDLTEPALPEKIVSCLPPSQSHRTGQASFARIGGAWQITYSTWSASPGY
jgi:hypothetical protein